MFFFLFLFFFNIATNFEDLSYMFYKQLETTCAVVFLYSLLLKIGFISDKNLISLADPLSKNGYLRIHRA